VIVTEAVSNLVESCWLVAVIVAVVLVLTVGARYRPVLETVPTDADHVTPTFCVFRTRAVNCRVPEDARVAVPGMTVTLMPDPEPRGIAEVASRFDWLETKAGTDRIVTRPNRAGKNFMGDQASVKPGELQLFWES